MLWNVYNEMPTGSTMFRVEVWNRPVQRPHQVAGDSDEEVEVPEKFPKKHESCRRNRGGEPRLARLRGPALRDQQARREIDGHREEQQGEESVVPGAIEDVTGGQERRQLPTPGPEPEEDQQDQRQEPEEEDEGSSTARGRRLADLEQDAAEGLIVRPANIRSSMRVPFRMLG